MLSLLSRSIHKFRAWQLDRHLERKPTAGNDSFQPKRTASILCQTFSTNLAFERIQREGRHSTRSRYGNGKPDNTPKRPAEAIFLPHGHQRVNDAGYSEES